MTRPGMDCPQWAMVDEDWGAVAEIFRVLRPGGRVAVTVWGHLKVSPGAWALAPFRLAAAEKVGNQTVDPELYARALASTGPAYEAIQNVGEAEFHRAAVEQEGAERA